MTDATAQEYVRKAQEEYKRRIKTCDATYGTGTIERHRQCLDAAKNWFDNELARCRSEG